MTDADAGGASLAAPDDDLTRKSRVDGSARDRRLADPAAAFYCKTGISTQQPMSDMLDLLRTALTERYTLQRELGGGGMATVYLATDVRHSRAVAIKVLRPELATALGPERFLAEIRTTAQLNHPHILPLLDSGEVEGLPYYVMPFVPGESLRERLTREKQLPLDGALQIARQVAGALSHAHRHGIVHRDIKPENILLAEDEAVVADFGIARAITAAGGQRLTGTGLAIGTPPYMSPEQSAGSAELDGRSDLYSLGCVLYEMLAGQPPFTGPTADSVVRQHLAATVPDITVIRPAVPLVVAEAIKRALAKTPADRFPTTTQFVEALGAPAAVTRRRWRGRRGLAFGVSGVVLALVLLGVLEGRRPAGPSLAVLPCTGLVGDSTQPHVNNALTQDLIDQLARSKRFVKVISFASSLRYRESSLPPDQIGDELGVGLLVFCRRERRAGTEGLSLQAVRAQDGAVAWSGDATVQEGALAGADFGIADGIARALGLRGRPRLAGRDTRRQPTARALSLNREAQYFLSKYTEPAMRKSIALFREAIDADSTFAEPYVGLGTAYLLLALGHSDADPRELLPLVHEAAERSLSLNPDLADAHALLASYLEEVWDWDGAERELRSALAINPSSAFAQDALAFALLARGRPDEAFVATDRAVELDPVDPLIRANAGVLRYLAGRYHEALAPIERALELDPEWAPGLWALGAVHAELGDLDQAIHELQRAYELSDSLVYLAGYLGYAYGLAGDTAAAQSIIRGLSSRPLPEGSGKAALARGLVYVGLGQRAPALAEFAAACRPRSSNLWFAVTGPPGRRLGAEFPCDRS